MDVEVLVIGSGGVWGKGPTLQEAKTRARKEGDLGKHVIIAVAKASAKMSVDGFGSVCWYGDEMPLYVVRHDKGARSREKPPVEVTKRWSSRTSALQTHAVEETIAKLST
jgi:hypothetical protein